MLVLDLVQMVDLVLSNLEVFTCLGSIFIQVLLLLVQLVDDFILVGNFIIQAPDGVVTVGLLLLQFLDSNFNVLNVLLDNSHLLLKNLLVSSGSLSLLLLLGQQSVEPPSQPSGQRSWPASHDIQKCYPAQLQ